MDLSGDESENWSEVCVCVLASVLLVLVLISFVTLCEVDFPSVKAWRQRCAGVRTVQENES